MYHGAYRSGRACKLKRLIAVGGHQRGGGAMTPITNDAHERHERRLGDVRRVMRATTIRNGS